MVSSTAVVWSARVLLVAALGVFLFSVVDVVLYGVHLDGGSAIDKNHVTDGELQQYLSEDRGASVIVSNDPSQPIHVTGDVVFNDVVRLQNDLTLAETVVNEITVRHLVTRDVTGDFFDITQVIENITLTSSLTPAELAALEAQLASLQTRYTQIKTDVTGTCADYAAVLAQEQLLQGLLVVQNASIAALEALVGGGGGGTNTTSLFATYNDTLLASQVAALNASVTTLQPLIDTLQTDALSLQSAIQMFLNTSTNGTAILAMISGDLAVLVGQIGALDANASALATSCAASDAAASSLLANVTNQLSMLNVTQLDVLNSTLLGIQSALGGISSNMALLNTLTNSTNPALLAQLAALNGSVSSCISQFSALLSSIDLLLQAANATSGVLATDLVSTNTTVQLFVTEVNTFLASSGVGLLPNLTAANATMYAQYNALVVSQTTLDSTVLSLGASLANLTARIVVSQGNVTTLTALIAALDPSISLLVNDTTALNAAISVLDSDASAQNANATSLLALLVALNNSYVTLQADVAALGVTNAAQQASVADHDVRLTALENTAANFTGSVSTTIVTHSSIVVTLTAAESITAADVVAVDDRGLAAVARGPREVRTLDYWQDGSVDTLGNGTVNVAFTSRVNGGRASAADTNDNVYLSLNYDNQGYNGTGTSPPPTNTMPDRIPPAWDDTNSPRLPPYSGVGDTGLLKYSIAQNFLWAVSVDSALFSTVSGVAVNPITQDVWISGHVMMTGYQTDLGFAADSRDVQFNNADSTVAYTHTLNIGAVQIDNIAIGFVGKVSGDGEWLRLFIFEPQVFVGDGKDFAVVQDVELDIAGNLYGCGFFSTSVSGLSIQWLDVDIENAAAPVVMATLPRIRPDLTIITPLQDVYLSSIARTSGFFFKFDTVNDVLMYWRSDEAIDDTGPGVRQAPLRFGNIELDSAGCPYLMGWYGEGAVSTLSKYGLFFTLDASGAAINTTVINRKESERMVLVLAKLDPLDGDYVWVTADAQPVTSAYFVPSDPTTSSVQTTMFNFYDPAFAGDISITHRGDVAFMHRGTAGGGTVFNFVSDSLVFGIGLVSQVSMPVDSHILILFHTSKGIATASLRDTSGSNPIGTSKLTIDTDSYMWIQYRQELGDATLGGVVVTRQDPSENADFLFKVDLNLNVIWGHARQSNLSYITDVSSLIVDRHRQLWFFEDVFSDVVSLQQSQLTPTQGLWSLGFRLVRAVDMTHVPIGVSADTVLPGALVNVVMHGTVVFPGMWSSQTVGFLMCNYHGALQSSRCYSMPTMGYIVDTDTISIDVHRDALRFPVAGVI